MIQESTVAGLKTNTGRGKIPDLFSGKEGVRSAECGVRSAECGVRSAECGVRSAECGVRSAECGVRSAECGVRSAECGVRSAECGVRSAECGSAEVRSAECGVRSAECGVRRAESQLMQTPRFPLSGKVGVWKTRSPKKKYCVILRVFRSVEKSECGKRGVLRKSIASYSVFSTLVENEESRLFLSFSQKIIIE